MKVVKICYVVCGHLIFCKGCEYPGMVPCGDGNCVTPDHLCDGEVQCPDAMDESGVYCGM